MPQPIKSMLAILMFKTSHTVQFNPLKEWTTIKADTLAVAIQQSVSVVIICRWPHSYIHSCTCIRKKRQITSHNGSNDVIKR